MKRILALTFFSLFISGVCVGDEIGFPGGLPSERGAVSVSIQDQHSAIIDLHLVRFIDDITITADVDIDDKTISITCDTTPVVGNSVCLRESHAFYQSEIIGVTPTGGNGYDIELSFPLDYPYTTAGGCSLVDENLNVDGSTTPVIFYTSPEGLVTSDTNDAQQCWDITRLMLAITDDASMDDSRFGGIVGGLENGIVLRHINGETRNIFNAKTNGDMALHAYDVTYVPDTLGPSGQYGLRVRRSFSGFDKNGVTVRVCARTLDQLQLIAYDDLTPLTSFSAVVQGHVVEFPMPSVSTYFDLVPGEWVQVVDGVQIAQIYIEKKYGAGTVFMITLPDSDTAPSESPYADDRSITISGDRVKINTPSPMDVYLWTYRDDIGAVVETF